jgi:hypothetical protein
MRWILGALLSTAAVGCTVGEIDDTDDDPRRPSQVPPEPIPDAPSSAAAAASAPPPSDTPPAETTPPPPPTGKKVELTYYWVAERPAGDPDEVAIKDCDGVVLPASSGM